MTKQPLMLEVTCPKCGERAKAEAWTHIDAESNPDVAQWLIDGFLFEWECPACCNVATLNHDCIFHDAQHKLWIIYVADESRLADAAGEADRLRQGGDDVRIVRTQHALREKAAIARDGLDDRAVEVVKFLLFNKFVEDGQLDSTRTAYYGALDEDGGLLVEFIGGGEPLETAAPRDVYDAALERIPHLPSDLLASYSVDRPWAAKANAQLA